MKTKSFSFLIVLASVLLQFSRIAAAQHYQQTNLVSDLPNIAEHQDPDLVNAWGLARSSTSPWWVADNGTGKSTVYHADGEKQSLIVTVPPSTGSTPTGIVFHSGAGFEVVNGTTHLPSTFIFVTENGTISAWNPMVNATNAIITVNNAGTANYKGASLGACNGTPYLYVANFEHGVDVFNSSWQQASVPGGFVDRELPEDYVPFNVQNIDGKIFVTFVLREPEAAPGEPEEEEIHGRGLGFVDQFDGCGNLQMRLQHGPWMNAPWGIAKAPGNFGKFSNNLLVGNFGSGQIAAFDSQSGEFAGWMHGERGPLVIEGLWALSFGGGNLLNNGSTNTLFFTAGIDDEEHGLFGTLTPIVHGNQDDQGENED